MLDILVPQMSGNGWPGVTRVATRSARNRAGKTKDDVEKKPGRRPNGQHLNHSWSDGSARRVRYCTYVGDHRLATIMGSAVRNVSRASLKFQGVKEDLMQAVTGVFSSRSQAEHAVQTLQARGIAPGKITLLIPGQHPEAEMQSVPVDATEQPGMGKAIGALMGGAAGLTGGLVAAAIPGVGVVSALGLLGAALLTAAGASVGAVAGAKVENSMTEGLPEDEIFVYENALRQGHSVLVVMADDKDAAKSSRELLENEGAEAVDAAREQWWIGLRSSEQEHYRESGRHFGTDEKFYRLGFEAALHARTRCREFDQVSAEMASDVEEVKQQYPDVDVETPFVRGYQRGREYYQRLCDEKKAA